MDLTTMILCGALLLCILLLILQMELSAHSRKRQAEEMRSMEQRLAGLTDERHGQQAEAMRRQDERMLQAISALRQDLIQITGGQNQQTETRLGQMAEQIDRLRESTQNGMLQFRQENERQLGEIRKTVNEKLAESISSSLSDSFAQINRHLEDVYKGLGEMQTLASGVGDLKKVLTNVKTRGTWGEVQLGSLLEQILAPDQYRTNTAVVPGDSQRVEFAIRLPGGESEILLPIDSKFPQEDYLRLAEASEQGDTAAVEESRKALLARLRSEAKKIQSKYIQPPYTTDFAVMFLPTEGLYAEVARDPGLLDQIQRENRIVVAGPTTFAALLNALQMGFRTLAIQQRTGEVWNLLGEIRKEFSSFSNVLADTQQRLRQASETIDDAFVRTRAIEKKLGRMEKLDYHTEESANLLPGSKNE